MDPLLFIASIAATMQAVQTWYQFRDSRRAAKAFRDRLASAQIDPAIQQQAAYISSIVPTAILNTLAARAEKCWTYLQEVLDAEPGRYGQAQIDQEVEAVKACLCRELKRISSLNQGDMPPGQLAGWWQAYCLGGGAGKEVVRPATVGSKVPVPSR
jgi:hypothetical protein